MTFLHSKTKVIGLIHLEIAGVEMHSANIHALADTRLFYLLMKSRGESCTQT